MFADQILSNTFVGSTVLLGQVEAIYSNLWQPAAFSNICILLQQSIKPCHNYCFPQNIHLTYVGCQHRACESWAICCSPLGHLQYSPRSMQSFCQQPIPCLGHCRPQNTQSHVDVAPAETGASLGHLQYLRQLTASHHASN